jgi:hypothetical protein
MVRSYPALTAFLAIPFLLSVFARPAAGQTVLFSPTYAVPVRAYTYSPVVSYGYYSPRYYATPVVASRAVVVDPYYYESPRYYAAPIVTSRDPYNYSVRTVTSSAVVRVVSPEPTVVTTYRHGHHARRSVTYYYAP